MFLLITYMTNIGLVFYIALISEQDLFSDLRFPSDIAAGWWVSGVLRFPPPIKLTATI
jgi:hypothetical protein